ncbi:AAA family ATPase [Treponema sp. Marseille-Q3903]|uniref:VirB4 family type IV secretion/conjugal transfer ATPase n=1 Tax=Treponema sp. Marseille-Q3903 TaxID=2766703 RepID=UPI0016527C7D|nr:AAA family ATPase [Treponema sp. Marseille-Q3903]MBC6713592.1 AAA family ATPase [Treponema sp. Marseille-Q3903]
MKIPFLDMFQFKEPLNQLKYVSPYAFILESNICLLKNGALMTTYQIEYPDLESSSANDIAAVAALFNRSIMTLAQNEGWAIFFDVKRIKTKEYPAGTFDNLTGWLIDQRRAENFEKFGEHYTSKYYISFVWQLPNDLEEKGNEIFFKDSDINKKNIKQNKQTKKNWAQKRDLKAVQENCNRFLDDCDKIMGAMTNKLWIHHLDKSELFSYIKSCISLEEEKLIFPDDVFFFLDNYICEKDVQTSMPLKIGEYYVPVMTVNDFPSMSYPAIFDKLNRTMQEYRWTTRFIPLSRDTSLKEADKYQNKYLAKRKSAMTALTENFLGSSIGKENQGALAMAGEASQINEDLTMESYVLGYYTSSLMCWDKKLEGAKIKSRKLQQIIRSCGFGVKEETLNNFQAWQGMWPGNVYANNRRPLISSETCSNIIPLSSAWQGNAENDFTLETCGSSTPLCICSTSYGTPFFMNLNVRDVGHTFVFGPIGAGKSTLLALLMAQATKYKDANVICIDKQLSSRAFMVGSGGVYVEPGKDKVAFQPLSELKSPDECSPEEYNESLLWCQQFIEGLLAQQNIDCTATMSKTITEALRLVSEKPTKDLTTFQQYVTYQDPKTGENTIRLGIEPYCAGGQFGSIFDADTTTLNLSKRMTIEMGSLMRLSEKAVAPALFYIFRYLEKLWNVPTGERQPLTFLFLDEAWLYLQHPIFASFIQEWLRTLRKKKVFCIFATQEVSAASKSSLKETIDQQCLTKIYLADESAQNPALARSYSEFGLTDSEIVALSNAQMKHDYYFKNPLGCRMFSLDLDDFQLALISSDHELLDHVEAQYGKNTTKELAFEILEATRQKYINIGKDPHLLDYEKYQEMLGAY